MKSFNSKPTQKRIDFLDINCSFMIGKTLKMTPEQQEETFKVFDVLTHFSSRSIKKNCKVGLWNVSLFFENILQLSFWEIIASNHLKIALISSQNIENPNFSSLSFFLQFVYTFWKVSD